MRIFVWVLKTCRNNAFNASPHLKLVTLQTPTVTEPLRGVTSNAGCVTSVRLYTDYLDKTGLSPLPLDVNLLVLKESSRFVS